MSEVVASGPVLCSVDERGVARVTLNRPEVYNAYNGEMIAGLLKIYDLLAGKALRAVVIAGKGRNFIAGADINWLDAVRRSSPRREFARLAHDRGSGATAQSAAGADRRAGARRLLRRRHRHHRRLRRRDRRRQ